MENVEIGMRVLVAGGKYSDVYGFSHNKPDVWYKFVKISTADGELKLTHSHHVYTTDGVFAAKMLKAGDSLILGGTRKPSKIVRIGSSFEKGLYNPHTVSGSIVVDGFLASTYTSHFDGFAAQAALSPFRMAFKCGSNSNILGRFLQYGLYDIAQLIASNMP